MWKLLVQAFLQGIWHEKEHLFVCCKCDIICRGELFVKDKKGDEK